MLAFGIPGDAVTAVILGGLLIQGVTPGVQLFRDGAEIVTPLFVGYFLAYVIVLILGLGLLPWYAKLAQIDRAVLFPWIAAVSMVAAFVAQRTLAAMWLTLIIGALGYLLRRFGYPLVPVLMGLLLGPTLESSFRRALIVSDRGPLIFLSSPISAVLLLAAAVLVLYFRRFQPRSS
jgi:putative tricarboxylic transport membrane protein